MANPQTEYQNKNHILHGAVKIEASPDGSTGSWVDAGGVNGAKIKENLQVSKQEADNVAPEYVVTDQDADIEFTQIESMSEAVRAIIRGSIDTVENTPGTEVSGYTQDIAANSIDIDDFFEFDKQNGNGTEPSSISIAKDPDGSPISLAEGTDYLVAKNKQGKYGIVPISGSAWDVTEIQRITMTYTPNASRTVYSGGKATLPTFYIRFTNTNENNKIVRWNFPKVQIAEGFELAFKKYNEEDDRVTNPVKMKAIQDITRDQGKQLYWIEDEVTV